MTGSGTQADPYIIYNVTDLQAVENSSTAYYELANDINASATSGWNEGAGFVPIISFRGSFDGKGFKIDSLFVNRPGISGNGLFKGTNAGAIIQNVGLTNVDITGGNNTGGLVGQALNFAGSDTIINCYTTGTVTGVLGTGGLVGDIENSGFSATLCYSTCTVVSPSSNVGGLIGFIDNGTVSKCFATGAVTGGGNTGGLVGRMLNMANVFNSYARGAVTGGSFTGGLVGSVPPLSDIDNSYSTGAVIGGTNTGGLIGETRPDSVTDSFWDTETSGLETSGGGTGKTTIPMKTKSTFTDAGWDFNTIWGISPSRNDGYPYLGAEPIVFPVSALARVTALVHRWKAGPNPVYQLEILTGGLYSQYFSPVSSIKEPEPTMPEDRQLPTPLPSLREHLLWLKAHSAAEQREIASRFFPETGITLQAWQKWVIWMRSMGRDIP